MSVVPHDVITQIALRRCDAILVISMECTCAAWRAALRADEVELWRVMVLSRFPRVASIYEALPAHKRSYRLMYKTQLRAEHVHRADEPKTSIGEDYIFTVEVVHKQTVMLSSTCRFHAAQTDEQEQQTVFLESGDIWSEQPEWVAPVMSTLEHAQDNAQLDTLASLRDEWKTRSFVTRVSDLCTVQLTANALDTSNSSGDCLWFDSEPLPMRSHALLFEHPAATPAKPMAYITFFPDDGDCHLNFDKIIDDWGSTPMPAKDLLRYLEHFPPW